MLKRLLILSLPLLVSAACTKKEGPKKEELWIYTSLYKDTIADIQPKLEAQFPNIAFNFFQAGSEEIASKFNAESLAGGAKADVIIASDQFWYEDLGAQGKLHPYKPAGSEKVSQQNKHPEGWYTAVSLPVMTLIYNSSAIPDKDAPKTFKEMADPKWKGKFTTGSPLASGTNFTTVAFLQKKYGWEYFEALRKNETLCEGGNSAVLRRVQTKERPVGWVLLENSLRFQGSDPNIKIVYPNDGVVMQTNVMAIVKKAGSREAAQKFADWMFSKEAQEAMIKSYMYATVPGYPPPKGAPELAKLEATAPTMTPEFLSEVLKNRESIKEHFTKIMFQ